MQMSANVGTTGKEVNALTAAREKAKAQQSQNVSRKTSSSETREAYINEVQFSGRLGKEPEYFMTPSEKELAKSSLAVFNPGDKEHSMWFDLAMWLNEEPTEKGPANLELFQQFLTMTKGEAVVVKGRLTMRVYNEKTYYTITLTDIG